MIIDYRHKFERNSWKSLTIALGNLFSIVPHSKIITIKSYLQKILVVRNSTRKQA